MNQHQVHPSHPYPTETKPQNKHQFISTYGTDLYKNHSVAFEKHQPARSYSHLPIKKDTPNWNQSSSVLMHSHAKYTIPKDQRFKRPTINYYNHYQIQYPSTLSNRGASIGIGNKADVPKVFGENKNGYTKDCPFYQVDDQTLRRNKSQILKNGKTIGQGWNSYQPSRTPHRSTVHSSYQTRSNPGHKYIISDKTGDRVQKTKMHERLRMFSDVRSYNKRDQPGPQNYLINQQNTKKSSSKTCFGYGKKSDFTNNPQFAATPGPIYKLSGFCDKYSNTKQKMVGKRYQT